MICTVCSIAIRVSVHRCNRNCSCIRVQKLAGLPAPLSTLLTNPYEFHRGAIYFQDWSCFHGTGRRRLSEGQTADRFALQLQASSPARSGIAVDDAGPRTASAVMKPRIAAVLESPSGICGL
jgi:hypothetical protein